MKFTAIVASLLFSAGVLAHGGGLDRSGCHHDRTAGGHHCHRGTLTGGQAKSRAAYDREDYLPRWADADGDCQNTRQEVLIAESRAAVTLGPGQCRVIAGRWHDPYTGRVFTDPGDLDIDHLVSLKEAHDSGAASWPRSRKRAYANDLSHPEALIAVYNGANRAKGARDPASWLPPNVAYRCAYVRAWTQVKDHWGLMMDRDETRAVAAILGNCRQQREKRNLSGG